jgi:hypothetical protein
VLIALQFAAFGWRLNREITVGDQRRRTWLPLPDILNLASMLLVTALCVVAPLVTGNFSRAALIVLGVGYTLIAFHPISVAAHYRLFSRSGREVHLGQRDGDYPLVTDQEWVIVPVSLVAAAVVGYFVWHS